MTKNFGIEESKLTREEFIEYVNSTTNIDLDYTKTLLDILDSYHVRLEVTRESIDEWIEF